MRLRSLIQLLEATRALVHPDRIVIIGSSSLLPTHPDLGEAGQPLETSYDSRTPDIVPPKMSGLRLNSPPESHSAGAGTNRGSAFQPG